MTETERPMTRAEAEMKILPALHDLNVRVQPPVIDGCHCNLITQVVLDALGLAEAAATAVGDTES